MHPPTALLRLQDGVISRRQAAEAGFSDSDLARWVRRRQLVRLGRGVYVDHTGPLTDRQRWWAAVLATDGSLSHETALTAAGVERRAYDRRVHLAIPHSARVRAPRGWVVHRMRGLDQHQHPAASPPRLRLETAALLAASACSTETAAIALLGELCQRRHTTPERLWKALAALPFLPGRALLTTVLSDVATGAYSALEHTYLVNVERPHGLPVGTRQRRVTAGRRVYYRDVEYVGLGVVVELDGRLGHELVSDRWADLDRDIVALRGGELTVRLGWGQALMPCRTAYAVGDLLASRGGSAARACGPGCRGDDR